MMNFSVFNVLKGDMSLVGYRAYYFDEIEEQTKISESSILKNNDRNRNNRFVASKRRSDRFC